MRNELERKELHPFQHEGVPCGFSMRTWSTCICGWVNKLYEGAFSGNDGNNGLVSKLFCQISLDMDQATARPHLSTSSAPGADHPAFVVRWVPGDQRRSARPLGLAEPVVPEIPGNLDSTSGVADHPGNAWAAFLRRGVEKPLPDVGHEFANQ
jgi:hypothetical protein